MRGFKRPLHNDVPIFKAPNNKIILTAARWMWYPIKYLGKVSVSRRISTLANQASKNETGCHQSCQGRACNLIARWLMSNVLALNSRLFSSFTRATTCTRGSKVFEADPIVLLLFYFFLIFFIMHQQDPANSCRPHCDTYTNICEQNGLWISLMKLLAYTLLDKMRDWEK